MTTMDRDGETHAQNGAEPPELAALREAIFEQVHRTGEPLREAMQFCRLIGLLGLCEEEEAFEPVATVAMAAWRRLGEVSAAWEALDGLILPPREV